MKSAKTKRNLHIDSPARLFSFVRSLRKRAILTSVAGMALLLAGGAQAQQAAPQPHVPLQKAIGVPYADRPVPSLAVLNAGFAKLDGGKLVLSARRRDGIQR